MSNYLDIEVPAAFVVEVQGRQIAVDVGSFTFAERRRMNQALRLLGEDAGKMETFVATIWATERRTDPQWDSIESFERYLDLVTIHDIAAIKGTDEEPSEDPES